MSVSDPVSSSTSTAGIFGRCIATGIDLLIWLTIAWFTWTSDISILFGMTSSKWRAVAELAGINLLVPACLSLELFTGATIGKWAVGLTLSRGTGTHAPWHLRLMRWFLKSSPWLLMTANVVLVCLLERDVMPPIVVNMTDKLGRAVEWCLRPLDTWFSFDKWSYWLLLPYVAFSQLRFGTLLLSPLVAGELLMLLPSRRTLIDRLTRTRVARRHSTHTAHGFEVVARKDRGDT